MFLKTFYRTDGSSGKMYGKFKIVHVDAVSNFDPQTSSDTIIGNYSTLAIKTIVLLINMTVETK